MADVNSKNKVHDLLLVMGPKLSLALIISMALMACGKNDQAAGLLLAARLFLSV